MQKNQMKLAVIKAGILDASQTTRNDFMIVLEPEAAAAYCLKHMTDANDKIKSGNVFF